MLILAWAISLIAVALVSYHYRQLTDTVASLKVKLTPKKEGEPVESIVLDPDDLVQRIRFEHEQKMRELNPEKDEL